MGEHTIVTGVLLDEQTTVSFVEVRQRLNLTEAALLELLEQGIFDISAQNFKQMQFNVMMLQKIEAACRLQQDLGVNVPGAVLALELLEELAQLRLQLSILQHHVDDF